MESNEEAKIVSVKIQTQRGEGSLSNTVEKPSFEHHLVLLQLIAFSE